MKCISCEREFEGERSTAKYCSASCRVMWNRVPLKEMGVSVTEDGLSVTKGEVSVTEPLSVTLDFTKDLKLDLRKDLGVSSWENGIFILPEITVEQVRRIRGLVGAKNGWEQREYRD